MLLIVDASFFILEDGAFRDPLPPGSISFDRVESAARETRCRSFIKDSTLLFTSSSVRLRLGSYTFSFRHSR